MKREAKPVLDASAVLAVLQDEPGARIVQPLLPRALISTVNVAEILAKLVRDGIPHKEVLSLIRALHLPETPFDLQDAECSAHYVGKNVSLGDRCFLAAAKRYGEGYTADPELCHRTDTPKLHSIR